LTAFRLILQVGLSPACPTFTNAAAVQQSPIHN
jgi:hypothetical protein